MGKLYFHCGLISMTHCIPVEVLGSLTATGLEMSTIGRELRVPADGERHIFSNNENLFNGMRVAICHGLIDPTDLVVHFGHEVDGVEQVTQISFEKSGRAEHWPRGFFDQAENDLMELLDWESKA